MEKIQSLVPTFKLNDGREIPVIAFGTGSKLKGTDVTEYVENALEAGFTHIDTAAYYKTEPYVANAIRNSGFSRSELFITTKFSGGTVPSEVRRSLRDLNLKSVDLYLIHSPNVAPDLAKAWAELETAKKEGLAKSIGVSNFTVQHLAQIVPTARVVPAVNQIMLHPYNLTEQAPTLAFCAAHGIVVEAYSSLTPITRYPGGPLEPVLDEIAARIGGTPAQVIFKWVIAKGAVVVTTTTQRMRLDEYLSTTSLPDLTAAELAEIDIAGARGPPNIILRAFRRIGHRTRDVVTRVWVPIAAVLFLMLNLLVLYRVALLWWRVLFQ